MSDNVERTNRNNNKDSTGNGEKLSFFSFIASRREKLEKEITEAKEPAYIAGLPLVLADIQDVAIANMIVADAGAGKSLLSRAIVQYILENYEDVIVVWVDLEYSAMVSKERKINELLRQYERFFYVTTVEVAIIRQHTNLETTAAIVNHIVRDFKKEYRDKKIFVVMDSFEDFIEDTSNDKELKRHLFSALAVRGVTYLFNHHIVKDQMRNSMMRFRGSMVIKAKLTTLLYLSKKEKLDDMTYMFELELLKVRTAYPPTKKLTLKISTDSWRLSDVTVAGDLEEAKILRTAFYLLKKKKELPKTELIESVAKEIRKHKDKVRSVIEKHKDFFDIKKGAKRTELYSLTTHVDILEEYCARIGVQDGAFSEVKLDVLNELENIPDDAKINIRIEYDGSVRVFPTPIAIRNAIHQMSDNEAWLILSQLNMMVPNFAITSIVEEAREGVSDSSNGSESASSSDDNDLDIPF